MVNNILDSTKKGYYKAKLNSSIGNDKKMWEVIIGLLKTKKVNKTLISGITLHFISSLCTSQHLLHDNSYSSYTYCIF